MEFVRIDGNNANNIIAGLIKAATSMCETWMRRPIMTQTFTQYLCEWPCESILELPKSPLVSVTSIKTYDTADVGSTFSSTGYFVDTISRPGRVCLKSGISWPSYTRTYNPIEIIFKAGYGTDPGSIPSEIKQAVLACVAYLHENRGDVDVPLPQMSEMLLAPHRDWAL